MPPQLLFVRGAPSSIISYAFSNGACLESCCLPHTEPITAALTNAYHWVQNTHTRQLGRHCFVLSVIKALEDVPSVCSNNLSVRKPIETRPTESPVNMGPYTFGDTSTSSIVAMRQLHIAFLQPKCLCEEMY